MSESQPIRFSVPEGEFDLALLPEAARERASEAFREAVTNCGGKPIPGGVT